MAEICGRFLVSLHSLRNNSRSVHNMQSDISQKHPTHLGTALSHFKVDKFLMYDIACLSKLSAILSKSYSRRVKYFFHLT